MKKEEKAETKDTVKDSCYFYYVLLFFFCFIVNRCA